MSTIAVVLVMVATFGANVHGFVTIVRTGAIIAGVLLILGAFVSGFLLSRRERRAVLGLGTAQRNIAAAMVLAARDFKDPDVLVMVTATTLAGLFVLFPIAWLLSKHAPHVGLPTTEACAGVVGGLEARGGTASSIPSRAAQAPSGPLSR